MSIKSPQVGFQFSCFLRLPVVSLLYRAAAEINPNKSKKTNRLTDNSLILLKHTEREQKVWNLYPVEILFKYILQVD